MAVAAAEGRRRRAFAVTLRLQIECSLDGAGAADKILL